MEDHLKNKDRLEQEWEGLCAYQAEPNARTIGMKDGNGKKNRSAAIVACKGIDYVCPSLSLFLFGALMTRQVNNRKLCRILTKIWIFRVKVDMMGENL